MCANESSLENIEIDSLVFDFAGNVAQAEVDQVEVADIPGGDDLLDRKFAGLT